MTRIAGRHYLIFITFFLLWVNPHAFAEPSCNIDSIDEQASVAFIFDGDTVRLTDGRRVRFLGINTPEVGQKGKPSQPYAKAAWRHLQGLLPKNTRVGLVYDNEKRDRYGRFLAHVYTDKGVNIAVRLLTEGLATTLVIPPNTRFFDCYAKAERRARTARRGIWRLAAYQAKRARTLSSRVNGYHLVSGQVQSTRASSTGVILELDGKLELRILHEDLDYFTSMPPGHMVGEKILARGWVKPNRKMLAMRIRHPAALEVIP